jgi:hypothetical protein
VQPTTSMFRIYARQSSRGIFVKMAILLLFGTLLSSRPSIAQIPPDSTALRIQFLNKSLQSDQQGSKLWWYSWLGFYGAATVGQGTVYFSSSEKSTRQDMALGAATAFAGVVGQFISTFQPVSFAEKINMLPERTIAEQQYKLTQMEKLLADRSLMETEARKWKAHILPTGINLVSGLVTWIGFRRTVWDGVVNFGLNCMVTETQIWSQPIRAKRALKRYREQFGRQDFSLHPHSEINCNFVVSNGGAGVRVTF